ncbi:MAG: DNA-processing protein DprA, partial [Kiritimatiellaeota bacterium]|nr:DNA-processing protein DprA [Kiritimatiellota bacterium]
PEALKSLGSPPLALYVRGDVAALGPPCLAMVGSRAPSHYGRETARRFAFQLAQMGITVVSGLARGIDTESHQGALKGQGRTVAVIGSALDCLYPAENRDLAEAIVASGGALVSEYPWGRQADRQTFPMRNRIVSGLSSGVLIVEAGLSSGTLITASHAIDQGRAVMAIPGRIDAPSAQGCHRLIKEGARLVDSIDDVLEEIKAERLKGSKAQRDTSPLSASQPSSLPASLDETERRLLEILGKEEMAVEDLMAAAELPAGLVTARLMNLEMKRLVRRLPGHLIKAL